MIQASKFNRTVRCVQLFLPLRFSHLTLPFPLSLSYFLWKYRARSPLPFAPLAGPKSQLPWNSAAMSNIFPHASTCVGKLVQVCPYQRSGKINAWAYAAAPSRGLKLTCHFPFRHCFGRQC
jgi:hypothetical protein